MCAFLCLYRNLIIENFTFACQILTKIRKMKENHLNQKQTFRFRKFSRKSYSAFSSLRKVVSIGVVSSCMLTFVHVERASAQAQTELQQSGLMEKELDEVMVTASLAAQPLNQTAKALTVITREQISQAPVQSLQDLLIYVAGVDVSQRGGHGVQADISVRGGTSDQTAILLNGVNLSNSQTGHYSFDIPINLSDIERIEIIQGSSSLIYGASAFSGGINIITKKDIDNNAYVRVGGGMHDLYEIETRGALKAGGTVSSLSFGYNTSSGYIGNSDYDIYNALWQTRFNFHNDNKIDLQLGYNNKRYGANTFYSAKFIEQYERTDTYLGTIRGYLNVGENKDFKIIPTFYWTRHHDQFDLIKNTPIERNHHRNDTYGGSLNLQYRSKFGTTILGTEIRKDEILSSNLGKDSKPHGAYFTKYDSRTNSSVALEHSLRIQSFILSAGLMMNYNSREKDVYHFLPSVSANYKINNNLKIYSSWSKAIRQPTFTDLYYKAATHAGNDSLKTERSENIELGFKYRNQFMTAYITGYMMWGKDMIDWIAPKGSDVWESCNLAEVDKQGVEIGIKFRLYELWSKLGENSTLSIDYVRMHQKRNEIDEDLESNNILNYLRDKFTISFNHQIVRNLTFGWYFRFQKREGQYKKYVNKNFVGMSDYPFYSTLDLKVNYKLKDLNFNVSMNNIYDRDYFDIGNIPQPGFWMMGGVSYTFK